MKLIDEIAENIREKYVLADKANSIADAFLAKAKKLDQSLEPNRLAAAVTALLHEVSDDRHFALQKMADDGEQAPSVFATQKIMRRNNYFFHSVQRLSGNVGYLDLRLFPFDDEAAKVAIGAMAFLANCSAIIFDLRKNNGGHPAMVQLLLSYLFEGTEHINSFFYRPTGMETQIWTMPWLPGKRLPSVPVYVLTSAHSASAAEEFAYDVQQMERGMLVGESTAGAAHPVEPVRLTGGFLLNLPTGRPINPVSKQNWEGMGVRPHIEVAAEKALAVAHLHAIRALLAQAEGADEGFWRWELLSAESNYEPAAAADLATHVGQYEWVEVVLENGRLHFGSSRGKRPLSPLANALFALNDTTRVRFDTNSLTVLYRDRQQTVTYQRQSASK